MISFMHSGGPQMASYRYRVEIPAKRLNAEINNSRAEILIFAKPLMGDLAIAENHKGLIVVDLCDDHLGTKLYQDIMDLANIITCPTIEMQRRIAKYSYHAHIVPDTYEFSEKTPHCNGNRLVWFGHSLNLYSLNRILPDIQDFPLKVVSNAPKTIQWSIETTLRELDYADIAIFPATKTYKSPNRVLEAIRRGCFVVAESHPSIEDFQGIWIGDIRQGIEFALSDIERAKQWTWRAQQFIKEKYSPKIQENAWRSILGLDYISEMANIIGMAGSTSIF